MPSARKQSSRSAGGTSRRGGLGADPFADLLQPGASPAPSAPSPAAAPAAPAGAPAAAARTVRERATFHVGSDLLEQVRDAVVHLSGPPERLTLTDFVERAFRAELARLAKAHHDGQPFPKRTGEVRVGRPIGR